MFDCLHNGRDVERAVESYGALQAQISQIVALATRDANSNVPLAAGYQHSCPSSAGSGNSLHL